MGDSNLAMANGDLPEEQLNRAIEELRGVLHDESPAPVETETPVDAHNTSLIMNIPVDVQIVLGNADRLLACSSPTGGIVRMSFSSEIEGSAEPWRALMRSASARLVERPRAMSSVTCCPPTAIASAWTNSLL